MRPLMLGVIGKIIMRVVTLILIVSILSLTNCFAGELKLTDQMSENNKIIREYISVGTSATDAIDKMNAVGFSCVLEREKNFTLLKGNIEIGQTKPFDLISCENMKKGPGSRRWHVYLILDATDKVQECSVTTEIVKP